MSLIVALLLNASIAYAFNGRSEEGLVFSQSTVDLGDVDEGCFYSWQIEVRNPTAEAITVNSVQSSCSCTKATLDQTTIASHGKARLYGTVKIPPGGATFISAVEVKWSHRDRSGFATVAIEGSIKRLADINPPSVSLGTINLEKPKEIRLTLTRGDSLRRWNAVSVSSDRLDTQVSQESPNKFIISATCRKEMLPIGPVNASVFINLLNEDGEAVLKYEVAVVGRVEGYAIVTLGNQWKPT
jgi:hypothetical protein